MKPDELPTNLGVPEQFFLVLMDIPDIESRLRSWLFKQKFTTYFVEIKQNVENLLRACVAVKKSSKLKRVLEIVLAFGNFLNYNTNRGGCWGYRIKDLSHIGDVRSAADSEKTMVHYIIDYMEVAYPEDCDFYVELQPLQEVSDLQKISNIKDELTLLKEGIKLVDDFMANPSSSYGSFRDIMSKFAPTSKKLVEKIDDLLDKGEKLFKEMLVYFGETATTTLDDFFGELYRFGTVYQKTRMDIQHKREIEERQKTRQEQIEKQKQQQKIPMGRLEKALADLSSGSAYAAPNKSRLQEPSDKFLPSKTPAAVAAPKVIKAGSQPQQQQSITPRTGPAAAAQKEQLAAALAFLKK